LTPVDAINIFDSAALRVFHGCGSLIGAMSAWSGLKNFWPSDPFDMAVRESLARSEGGQPRRDHLDDARCGG
jgi:hypothetical protein